MIPAPTTPPGHTITVHATPPRTHGRRARLVLVCECGAWFTVTPPGVDLDELTMRAHTHHALARPAVPA